MPDDLVALFQHALRDAGPEDDPTEGRILDAALAEIGEHGTRGATVDAIAARAEVGRITVFRRFGSKEALVARAGLRELRRFLTRVEDAAADIPDPADRIAAAFLACVRLADEHPLVARVARHEPEATFGQLTRGTPSALDLGIAYVAGQLDAIAQETGRVAGEPRELAEVLVRLALTYVLVPSALLEGRDDAEVLAFARRVLVPVALGVGV